MSTNEELHLGTVFTGRVDSTFRRAVSQLRNIVQGLTTVHSGLQGQSNQAAGDTRKLNNELSQTNKQLSNVTGGFQRLSAAIKVTASYGLAGTFLLGVINGLKQGSNAIVDYDQSLKNLQAITGATDADIAVLGATIKDVASETKYSATEAGEAAVLLGQAGFTAAESTVALRAVAMLATGTLSDMTSSADLLTTTIRAFGLEAIDSGKVADVFAKAVNKSKLTIDKLRTAFNYVGPIADKAGLSVENTAASAMILANAGLRASSIGTGLRQVIARLVAPTSKLEIAFKAAGAEMDKLNPKTASMEEVIRELTRVVPNARRAFELFGLRGASAVSALVEAGPEKFALMRKELFEVGAASDMAEKQMEGLGVMSKNLFDRLGRLAIAIGDGGVADAVRTVLAVVRPLIGALTWFAESLVGKMIVGVLSLTSVLTGLGFAFQFVTAQMVAMTFGTTIAAARQAIHVMGLWAVSIEAVKLAFMKLWIVMKSPIGIVGVISAIIVAFVTLKRYLDGTIDRLKEQKINLEQTSTSLRNYKKSLEDCKEGSDEYESTLKRLIKEFPELEKHVDLATMKWKDHGEALKNAIREQDLEKIRKTTEIISQYDKLMAKNRRAAMLYTGGHTGEFQQKYLDKQKSQIELLSKEMLDYGLTTRSMYGDIKQVLKEHTDFSEAQLHRYAIAVKKHYNELEAEKKKQKDAEPFNIIKDLNAVDAKWADLYENLGQSGNIKAQGDLREAVDKMLKDLDKLKEKGQDIGWTDDELEAQLNAARKKHYDNFKKTLTGEKILTEKEQKERLEAVLKRIDDEIAAEKGKVTELNRARKEDLKYAKDSDDKKKINKYYDKQIADFRKEQAEKQAALDVEFLEAEGKKIEALQLEIKLLEDKRAELIKNGEVGKQPLQFQALGVKIVEKEKELDEEVKKNKQKTLDERLAHTEKYSDEYIQIMEEMYAAEKIKLADLEAYKDQKAQHDFKRLRDRYEKGLATWEEYYEVLKALKNRNEITDDDFNEIVVIEKGNFFERFKLGAQQAKQSWGEFTASLGEQSTDRVADGLTDTIMAFTDKTKSAKETFKDFAKETLAWMLKMIIRQRILNALQNSGGKSGKGGWVGTAINAIGQAFGAEKAHTGGTFGKTNFPTVDIGALTIPKFHSGFNSDEILALVRKNESIFTENDTNKIGNSLSKGGGPPVNYFDFSNSRFWDKAQAIAMMDQISKKNVSQNASRAVMNDLNNDHPLRSKLRGGI